MHNPVLGGADYNIATHTANSVTLPSGLKIKWGEVNGTGNVTINFAVAFTVAPYCVLVTPLDANFPRTQQACLLSRANNNIHVRCTNYAGTANANVTFSYFAIGI